MQNIFRPTGHLTGFYQQRPPLRCAEVPPFCGGNAARAHPPAATGRPPVHLTVANFSKAYPNACAALSAHDASKIVGTPST